jgi:hypothetical protein
MHIIPHNLLSDEHMWAQPCCTHIPPGQEHVPQDEAHEGCCEEFMGGLGRRLPINYGCWIVVFVWCNYLTILYITLLYSKDMTFISVPWVIICVRLDPSTHLVKFVPGFGAPKTRVWQWWISCAVTVHLSSTKATYRIMDHDLVVEWRQLWLERYEFLIVVTLTFFF